MASDSTAPAEAGPLSAAFERGRGAGDLPPGLEAVLLALHQRAQAGWPEVAVDAEEFVRWLGERAPLPKEACRPRRPRSTRSWR